MDFAIAAIVAMVIRCNAICNAASTINCAQLSTAITRERVKVLISDVANVYL